ncbi:MAG: hypothetical protein G01um101456_187 [Parcubacteria group bacterium Gr01-1014_56]|nr:MAG: hypothetical protein G01um101456_187 [Parcubacteria group bacterium Gr01-1014_56]
MTTTKRLTAQFLVLTVAFVLALSVNYLHAWTSPPANPPNSNVAAPINEGTTSQTKNGILGVNALAVFGDLILSGTTNYLNFGTVAGSSGYGIRNNSGTIEFKNSGGAWAGVGGSGSGDVTFTGTVTAGAVKVGSRQVYLCPNNPSTVGSGSSCAGQLTTMSSCSYDSEETFNSNQGNVRIVRTNSPCTAVNLYIN